MHSNGSDEDYGGAPYFGYAKIKGKKIPVSFDRYNQESWIKVANDLKALGATEIKVFTSGCDVDLMND